jgi:2-oxoacid:acceptor oxidoreductase gamma subunit (pyruvate/2-ketoisovalerate family)
LTHKIFEARFHGRGGQGAWTASERAGAPITAFTRISEEKIQLHSSIYEPDVVVVLDPTLLGPLVSEGVNKDTIMVVNTSESGETILKKLGLDDVEIWTVDATELAIRLLGRPITNTAMLGAIVRATGVVKLNSIIDVVKARFTGKIGELNADVAKKAYEEVIKI